MKEKKPYPKNDRGKISPTNNVNMLNNIMKEIANKKGTNKKK